MLLTFLIPAYCRRDGALNSALSVLRQCNLSTKGVVQLWIQDDCSPEFDLDHYNHQLTPFCDFCDIRISSNHSNLGMSRNILDMVQSVNTGFWTVLTDDDFLLPDSLISLLDVLRSSARIGITTLATLRYCHDETGVFLFKDVVPGTSYPSIIPYGPINSFKYLQNAHVLTGLIVQSGLDTSLWRQHLSNAYFPMINFSTALLHGSCLTIDQPWFRHTVNNATYWHDWGDSDIAITKRLHSDYLAVLNLVFRQATNTSIDFLGRLSLLYQFCRLSSSTLIRFSRGRSPVYLFLLVYQCQTTSFFIKCILLALSTFVSVSSPIRFMKPFASLLLRSLPISLQRYRSA